MNRSQGMVDTQEDRFDEAAEWYSRWGRAPASGLPAVQVDEWAAWVNNPDNQAAYDAVQFASQVRHEITPPPRPTAAELAAEEREESNALPSEPVHRATRRSVRRWRGAALFATAAAVAAIGFVLVPRWASLHLGSAEPVHVVATAVGERKRISLPDGSLITLDEKTELSVHYGRCLRTILLNAGEALFKVEHDAACPFIVIAADGAITALGTAFTVRRTLDRVTVRVAEGAVSVQPRDALVSIPWPQDPDAPSIHWEQARLAQGQEVSYDGNSKRSPIESEDPKVATGWLEGRREYRHEPLSYVIADVNRYFDKQIVLGDDAVGELQFTGRVYDAQVQDWLRALETIFPVDVTQSGDRILIRSRHIEDSDAKRSP